MTATTFAGHFLGPDIHANRPATTGLPEGTMYVCTTHAMIERIVSAAWVNYATLGGGISAVHGCRAYSNAVQSISSSVNTAATLNTEEYDTDAYHDNVTNNTRITVPSGLGGKYLMAFSSFWNASPGTGFLSIKINGSTLIRGGTGASQTPGGAAYALPVGCIAVLAVGDYVEGYIWQTSGGAINVGHASSIDAQTTLTATFLGT